MNNRMRKYKLTITDAAHYIQAPDGALVVRMPRVDVDALVADGFMEDEADVMGLNMTLNMRGVIRPGSRLELVEEPAVAH